MAGERWKPGIGGLGGNVSSDALMHPIPMNMRQRKPENSRMFVFEICIVLTVVCNHHTIR